MRKFLGAAASLALTAVAAPVGAQSDAPAAAAPAIDRTVMHAQVILDSLGFSPGVIDGREGQSLTAALKGFQTTRGLETTGKLDMPTLRALHPYRERRPTTRFAVPAEVLQDRFINPLPDDPQKQAELESMAYRRPLEKLAEMFHTTPDVLIELNPGGGRIEPGATFVFPNVIPESKQYQGDWDEQWRKTLRDLNVGANQPQGEKIVVDESDGVLRVFDAQDKLVAQFSATMGSEHDPLPLGTWKINVIDTNPEFHYNPDLFWDADDSDSKALLPPGPNGPVGVVWLDLSKEHYGIHGTPEPQTIGRTQSHGCIRLTNWDAARLALMVKPGVEAVFQA